ncbi:glycosyltransferase family 2 protein [Confluentibacter lentus]|uniref:glycosyltransferase family 2 protein n=1 Tax=Confluentibacter lentus TaxID=1699412 RepID=UPI000C283807|nr:glycosyltransferase [Confluentibacter lentus]
MNKPGFSILIATKDRIEDLKFTLKKNSYLIERNDVECIICDDGSVDGTSQFIESNFPQIKLIRNFKSKGYIYCRNLLLNNVKTEFAISLDDDAHIVTEFALESMKNYFDEHLGCGVLGLRIYWGLDEPKTKLSNEKACRVRAFVGCGHVWRMKAWSEIPNYPEWFIFYGEEEFASYHLYKNSWEIHYLPEVLIQHRVDIKNRKKNSDYLIRLRRSLASGWYLYFLFWPKKRIPKQMIYSIFIQFKNKVVKGDIKAFIAIVMALLDLIKAFHKVAKHSNRFSDDEFKYIKQLPETKIYWKPE